MPKVADQTQPTAPQGELPTENQTGQTAYDALPPEHKGGSTEKPAKRRKVWLVARIENYGLSALAACDPEYPEDELDWSNLGAHTWMTTDREAAWNKSREYGGLLVNAETIPRPASAEQLHKRIQAMASAPF